MKHRIIVIMGMLTLASFGVSAQKVTPAADPKSVSADTLAKPLLRVLKKVAIGGTIRTRYNATFNKHIDIDGLQHSNLNDKFADNAFTIPNARLYVAGDISEKLDVYVRVNFGDFKGTPTSKVLEYAYATYHLNPYLNVRMGVFRPNFGREDDVATDFLKSFDFSNQYTAFDENGWMNYQMGLSIMGQVKAGDIPIKYFAGVFNGNRRNNFTDDDNGKQFPARVEVDFSKNLQVGINGGLGKEYGASISAWGADVNFERQLSHRLHLEVESEFKQGNNQSLFFSQDIAGTSVSNYMMRGAYILPSVMYKVNSKEVKGFEASFKYEYFDPNFKRDGNVRQQYVPMVGVDFAEQYALRLQFGVVMDRYDHNIENTTQYNSNRFLTQLQIRF
ncbi:porin [Pedobacter sp. AW31-3R]|uniref:porin n=1 Tax=Pedobacter sp. AW31-3R TaxID=3445781 RepID=UPI003FA11277